VRGPQLESGVKTQEAEDNQRKKEERHPSWDGRSPLQENNNKARIADLAHGKRKKKGKGGEYYAKE